jgi:hypothetical protein
MFRFHYILISTDKKVGDSMELNTSSSQSKSLHSFTVFIEKVFSLEKSGLRFKKLILKGSGIDSGSSSIISKNRPSFLLFYKMLRQPPVFLQFPDGGVYLHHSTSAITEPQNEAL